MRRLGVALLAGLLLAAGPVAPLAHADPGPRAVARWSMVPQSTDVNGDGVIDGDGGVPASGPLSRQPAARMVGAGNHVAQPHERLIGGALSWYLSPAGFPVRLDACGSRGDEARWRVTGADALVRTTPWRPLSDGRCRSTLTLPEGGYAVALDVRSGARIDRAQVSVRVSNLLVVSLGDSYASGEGNPRNVMAWLRRGGALTPYWDDDACHRSARGAPAQAALALEESSAHSSVTLVHVACSGATVDAGILGPQGGAGQASSQVEQAAALMGSQAADLVLLSVGGNDVGFTSILQTCALNADCPVARPGSGPIAGYPTVQSGVQAQTGALAADYARIAACLGGSACRLADGRTSAGLALAPGAKVLPTLYPDITRAADGGPCTYLSIPAKDFAWARATVLDPSPPPVYAYPLDSGRSIELSVDRGSLNQQVASTSRLPGWVPVTGTWASWADPTTGHGVCAGSAAWVFAFTGLTALPSASFHPNPVGQDMLAQAVADAARALVTR